MRSRDAPAIRPTHMLGGCSLPTEASGPLAHDVIDMPSHVRSRTELVLPLAGSFRGPMRGNRARVAVRSAMS